MNRIYAQMYSVREHCESDFKDALSQISKMGYDGVEFAGYYNIPPKELSEYMNSLNLKTISSHVSVDRLKNNLANEIEYLKALGAKYMVCAFADIHTIDNATEYAKFFNEIGVELAKHDNSLMYHNHSHELVNDNGEYPLDALFDSITSDNVYQQIDVYWLANADVDPIAYLSKHVNRIPIIHLKQMENPDTKKNMPAPDGYIDMAKIMKIAPNAHYVYEQEYSDTIMKDMEKSLKHLKGLNE